MSRPPNCHSEADPESTPAWAKSPMQIEGYLFRGHGFRLIGIGIAIGIGFDRQIISIAIPMPIAMVKIHAIVQFYCRIVQATPTIILTLTDDHLNLCNTGYIKFLTEDDP